MSVGCLAPCEPETTSYVAPVVELRPLERGDSDAVLEIFDGLSARSRELRFLTAKPRLTSADLHQLTDVDHRDHVAIVAAAAPDGHPVGVARFVRDPADPGSADVAVTVVDAWQNAGVGTMLVTALVRRANALGVRRFTMMMASDNEAAVRLLRRAPGEIERLAIDGEVTEFALTLPGAPVGAVAPGGTRAS